MLRVVVLMGLLAVEGSAAALPNNGKTLTASLFALVKNRVINFRKLFAKYTLGAY